MGVYLTSDRDGVRLKSYDATIKGETTTLRITLEITDTFELSMLLRELAEMKRNVRARPAATSAKPAPERYAKRITKQPMLALPAPYLEGDE